MAVCGSTVGRLDCGCRGDWRYGGWKTNATVGELEEGGVVDVGEEE